MSNNLSIEVIIVNWRRPKNIPLIVEAFRNQTVGCSLTICDVGSGEFQLPSSVLDTADTVFQWKRNFGGFNRYVASLGFTGDLCWFHDDDMLPGREMLSYMLNHTEAPFGVLGQYGRRVTPDSYAFAQPNGESQEVDFVCRGYLVPTHLLHCVSRFISDTRLSIFPLFDDDILLSLAIRTYTGLSSRIVPKPHPEAKINLKDLPAQHAISAMDGHLHRRKQFFLEYTQKSQSLSGNGKTARE